MSDRELSATNADTSADVKRRTRNAFEALVPFKALPTKDGFDKTLINIMADTAFEYKLAEHRLFTHQRLKDWQSI